MNKSTPRLTVVSAAAGTGKTTRLVQEYLKLLRAGIPPSRIVAITFTRKAAAELVETVSRSLRHTLKEPVPKSFAQDFDACYQDHLPDDPEFVRTALNELPNAPAGTIDSFVQRLLSEFALEARLPINDEGPLAWLDLPIGQGDTAAIFEAAIRDVIDPTDRAVPPEAAFLLNHMSMKDLLAHVSETARALPLAEPVAGKELARQILSMVAQAFPEASRSSSTLVKDTPTITCKPFHRAVQTWVQGDYSGEPPLELVPWCGARISGKVPAEALPLQVALAGKHLELGIAKIPLDTLVPKLVVCFDDSTIDTSDQIRQKLLSLAKKARAHALRALVQANALDHDLLTEAAIDLCARDDRSQRLRNRFDALLVDEVQDSSPRQFRLYQALEELPGDGKRLRAFYVGDFRQSIYLFRGAEPAGLTELEQRADALDNARQTLDTNFRSTPAMVEAQKALFARASGGIGDLPGLPGVAAVDHVKSLAGKQKDELPAGAPVQAPIALVTLGEERTDPETGKKRPWSRWDFTCTALDVFVERVRHAWNTEGRKADTAAVLTASWSKAINARDRLRAVLRKDGAGDAFLDGNRELAKRPVARDVRTLVQALWDRSDDISWAALWRHPMIGLTDGALAALKDGLGLHATDPKIRGLAGCLSAEALSPDVYPACDVAAFARVRPHLHQARRDIGRIPTADVVERLTAALQWRPILLTGPEGLDAVGELEVVLDWIRQAESDRVDPAAVVALLDPDQAEEPPRVEFHRGERTISCTTIHQAKGLKYDHVLVVDVGTSPSGNDDTSWSRAAVTWDGAPRTLLGVKLDPDGALKPVPDLQYRLAQQVEEIRRDEERLRLAYVAVTRAVRSATMSVCNDKEGIHADLHARWTADPEMPGVARIVRDEPASIDDVILGHARAVGPFPVPMREPSGWQSVPPSSAHLAWRLGDAEKHRALVADIAARCEFRPGQPPCHPPPVPGEGNGRSVSDADWGTLVHAWMEFSTLRPDADLALAGRFLAQKYGMELPALADWLVKILRQLDQTQPELLAALRSDGATLHFEMPFAGVSASLPNAPWYHAGRMDLMVTWPGRRAWVIDFKAGSKSPAGNKDDAAFVKMAGLEEYAPQLEAYRHTLTAAGWTVEKVGLLFMRTGAWVGW